MSEDTTTARGKKKKVNQYLVQHYPYSSADIRRLPAGSHVIRRHRLSSGYRVYSSPGGPIKISQLLNRRVRHVNDAD